MEFGPHLFLAILEGGVTAFVLALTALGLSLVFGVMRIVNVAHGEFFMLGAVITWFCTSALPDYPLLGFCLALIVAPMLIAIVAFGTDWAILRRVNYNPESTIVATIGLLYLLQQLVLLIYGPEARPVAAPVYFRIQFPWFGYSGYKLVVAAASASLLVATWLLVTRSRLGLHMRAAQQDLEIAQVFGVEVRRTYAIVFMLGAALAGIAGVLVVPIQQAHYLMGLDPLLLSFVVVIIGGLGSLRGSMLAALMVGMGDGIVSVFFSPTLAKILATLLVAGVLVFRPQGLFGERE